MSTTAEASLPAKVWINIFNNFNSSQQLMQCSLVSKRWQHNIGSVISSKSIHLQYYNKSKFVYNRLKNNSVIYQSVKHLAMTAPERHPSGYDYDKRPNRYYGPDDDINSLEYFRKLVLLVVTQNAETFEGSMEGPAFFEFLLIQVASEQGIDEIQ